MLKLGLAWVALAILLQAPLPPGRPVLMGPTVAVHAGQDLQAAIDMTPPGTTLVLDAGGVWRGNYVLRAKACSGGQNIIRSSLTPPSHAPIPWVLPADAPRLAAVETPNTEAAVRTEPSACFWVLQDLEIRNGSAPNFGTVLCGDGSAAQNTLALVPHDIVFDHVYIHDTPAGGGKRGLALNCAHATVNASYLSGFIVPGQDTQAILGWNGPGPFTITNSYLEGASENVMFGGADPSIPNLIPSDIVIRGNYIVKPLAWQAIGGTVKNLLEFKNAQRILVENNVFENLWADAQPGNGLLLTVRNQDGTAPWSTVRDYTFQYNVIKNVTTGYAFNMLGLDDIAGHASVRCVNATIQHVLVLATRNGFISNGGCFASEIAHTTMPDLRYHVALLTGSTDQQWTIRDNVFAGTEYGIFGDGDGLGQAALDTYAPNHYVMRNNVLEAGPSNINWPPGQFLLGAGTLSTYLDAQKRYIGPGTSTDGMLLGADIDGLLHRIPWLVIP